MSERNSDYHPSGIREFTYFILSLVAVGASIYLDYIGFMPSTSWFQRSGSVLVVLGVISESKYVAKIITDEIVELDTIDFLQKVCMHSGFLIALFGTLIWGYGDLISHT